MTAAIPSHLFIALPLAGAAVPLLVTQVSRDLELRAVGRSVMKYVIAFPVALVIAVFGLVNFIV